MYALIRDREDDALETNIFSSLNDKECTSIAYNDNFSRITWQSDDEIVFNSQEYDVAKVKTVNGKTYLFCITENKENELLSDISFAYASDHTTDIDSQLIFSDECILNSESNPVIFFTRLNKKTVFDQSVSELSSDILLPPPRQFSV